MRRLYEVSVCLAAFLVLFQAGCLGLSKRPGARDASYGKSASSKVVADFARSLEAQTSLSRSSGEVTYLRLARLFPSAVGEELKEHAFTLMGGAGLMKSFGQLERPSGALAQIALREKAAELCKIYVTGGGSDRSLVFETQGAFLADETKPSDPAVLLALAAARNIWLDLYLPSSPEVQELASLYRATLAGAGELEARRDVCMAALLAPQFWLGNPTSTDPVRRIALEVGRRLPTMGEISDFAAGRVTAAQYAEKIQSEPGYFTALRSWHQEWLGLRPFLAVTPGSDLRASLGQEAAGGAAYYTGVDFFDDGVSISPTRLATNRAQVCEDKPQDFDPRLSMIVWEHLNSSTGTWDLAGAWYAGEGLAIFLNYLTQSYQARLPGFDAETLRLFLCKSSLYTHRYNARCGGLLDLSGGAPETSATYGQAIKTYLDALPARIEAATDSALRATLVAEQTELTARTTYPGRDAATAPKFYLTKLSDIVADAEGKYTVGRLAYFAPGDQAGLSLRVPVETYNYPGRIVRRLRRFAPSGEQDGYSTVRMWYTGEPRRVCNGIDRYWATCFTRFGTLPYMINTFNGAAWNADLPGFAIFNGGAWAPDAMSHPAMIGAIRCGKPNVAAILAWDETKAYPFGFTPAQTYGSSLPAQAGLNDLVASPAIMDAKPTPTSEYDARTRLVTDIQEEPYYLLEHIVGKNRDYRELFTADYTCGGRELEIFYRTRGYHVPVEVSAFDPELDQAAESCGRDRRVIRISTALPTRLIRNTADVYEGGGGDNVKFASPADGGQGSGVIPPKVMSGVLTMPAFLAPVSPKMRAVASRYFQRLLCADPNLFVPQGDQVALHSKYISKREHLEQPCFMCHVNLDPLAAALSANFVKFEGQISGRGGDGEDVGEMALYAFNNNYRTSVYGVRGGGPLGEGALLGQPVQGVREVAQVLTGSREWARCVVSRTFEFIYGRVPSFEDMTFVNETATKFTGHYRYNQLVRELITSPLFLRRN